MEQQQPVIKLLLNTFIQLVAISRLLVVLWKTWSRLATAPGRNYEVRLRLDRDAVYDGGLERGPLLKADPLQCGLEVRLLHLGHL